MRQGRWIGLVILASLLGVGCGRDNLSRREKLDGLRVLAIQASTPEVDATGGPVTITPLITDISGAGRTLDYAWEACADPGVALGASPNCARDPSKQSGSGTLVLAAPRYTAPATAFAVTVPPTVLVGRSDQDKHNGVAFLVVYTLSAPAGEKVTSYKRILVSTRGGKNSTNPAIAGLKTRSGETFVDAATLPSAETALQASVAASTAESYTLLLSDGSTQTRTERLTISWLVSDGELKYSRTETSGENTWTPSTEATSVAKFVLAVLRDDRGGVSYAFLGP